MNKLPAEIAVETTHHAEMINITAQIQAALTSMPDAHSARTAVIFIPHTTAAVTVNENTDPDVATDIINALEKLVPWHAGYRHTEGNSAAHVKASVLGSSVTVPLRDGYLLLGRWQAIYFCEFDGPRRRTAFITVNH